jgi:hypothetical protein
MEDYEYEYLREQQIIAADNLAETIKLTKFTTHGNSTGLFKMPRIVHPYNRTVRPSNRTRYPTRRLIHDGMHLAGNKSSPSYKGSKVRGYSSNFATQKLPF